MKFLVYNVLVTKPNDSTEEGELSWFEKGLSDIPDTLLIRSHRLPLIKNVLKNVESDPGNTY